MRNSLINYKKIQFLDGRKPNVIKHGSTAPETLLQDAARVCKEYIARNPDEVRFTVIALAANE